MNMHAQVSKPLEHLFENIKVALLAGEVQSVVQYFAFPLCCFDGRRTVVLEDEVSAIRALEMMWMLNQDFGMEHAETLWMMQHRVSADFVLADVTWRLSNASYVPVCDQRTTYSIRGTGDNARIVAIFFHEDSDPRPIVTQ